MTLLIAGLTDGAWNLFWMYLWLASTIAASYLSERKGYGDRPGLATGLILSAVGAIIWLIVPAKPESKWKVLGPFGRQKKVAA
ncbi:hypothetical protein DVA67_010025 [Solirubrobacter sp. CPCC 204708]|uniref:Cardiolipin synthase N-terminal domain-containing protein n=1 Tax=Solirubrobacter deserti TaxID=2282478 RepID=A0ABT4RTF4_9ACTN|nr:hypothetical protein [Solirubrobacter deserti]MBE2316313.1 hypothetical protein [Solirubrobacter deserti]MDA0141520.1 hypothetical protein [Solirubrobacter deserti]